MYDPGMHPARPQEPDHVLKGHWELDVAAKRVSKEHPDWSTEACVSKALEESPELYMTALPTAHQDGSN
jgi:hypothetical protein